MLLGLLDSLFLLLIYGFVYGFSCLFVFFVFFTFCDHCAVAATGVPGATQCLAGWASEVATACLQLGAPVAGPTWRMSAAHSKTGLCRKRSTILAVIVVDRCAECRSAAPTVCRDKRSGVKRVKKGCNAQETVVSTITFRKPLYRGVHEHYSETFANVGGTTV